MKQTTFIFLTGLLLLNVFTALAQPSNDDCANAIALSVNSDLCDGSFIEANNIGATDSGLPLPACANYEGGDMWYTVIVPASGEIVISASRANGTPFSSAGMEVYSGSCAGLTAISCDNNSGLFSDALITLDAGDGIVASQTLFVRVWENGNDGFGEFRMSAWDPAVIPPVPNDDCSSAIPLTLTPYGDAPISTIFCNAGATDSGELPIPDCVFGQSDYQGGDLWYTVQVPASGHFRIQVIAEGLTLINTVGAELYQGSCGSLASIECSVFLNVANIGAISQNRFSFGERDPITPGETLYLRVWVPGNSLGSFSIQFLDLFGDPPANDICNNAEVIPFSDNVCDASGIIGSMTGATYSGRPEPDRNNSWAGDIWYTVQVPASGEIYIQTRDIASTGDDAPNIEVYQGNCTTLSFVGNEAGFNPINTLYLDGSDGISPGETLIVRVYYFNFYVDGEFEVLAFANEGDATENDLCADAITIPVVGIGDPLETVLACNGSTTDSGELPLPDCNDYQGGDLWFTLTMPASGYLDIFASPVFVDIDMEIAAELYRGACGSLTSVECSGGENYSAKIEVGEDDGINPGETLYLRVWEEENDDFGEILIFALEIEASNPPDNDRCVNASELSVNVGACELTYSEGTFVNALESGGIEPDCANYEGHDVWYTVTVPASETLTILTNGIAGSIVDDTALEVYAGDCNTRVFVACDDDGTFDNYSRIELTAADGISSGEELLIRVWPYGGEGIGTFLIAAFEPSVAPANDDCANATVLAVAMGCDDVVPQLACNDGANPAEELPLPTCGDYDGGDIWFQAVVPVSGSIVVQTFGPLEVDTEMEVYTGSCGSLTSVACNTNDGPENFSSIALSGADGISPGQMLLIRVWEDDNDEVGEFQIYAFDPAFTPANDDCINASPLPVELNGACNPIQACNYGATASPQGIPECNDFNSFYLGGDVWFSMIVPPSGIIAAGSYTDVINSEMALYTGDCNNLVEAVCETSAGEFIGMSGLTPGETVYLRFWTERNEEQGIFDVCAFSAPDPPVCSGSQYSHEVTINEEELDAANGMVNFSFPNVPSGAIEGILYITGIMDLDDAEEVALITEEGGTLLARLRTLQDESCSYTILSLPLTGDQIDDWAMDGTIDFNAFLSPEVVSTCGTPDSKISMRLVYCYNEFPFDFTAYDEGINCDDGTESSYDSGTETFTMTSEGCYDPNYYSNTDSHGFVGSTLCGDGEIIAQVTSVSGFGWAGISMRESLSTSAKMVQLSIDGTFLTKREFRQSTGGLAFNHFFQTLGKNWLRLTRTGNIFSAYHSLDGISWSPVLVAYVSMTNCLDIGLFTENKASYGSMTATFNNVEVFGGGVAPFAQESSLDLDMELSPMVPKYEANLFPNPARDEVFVEMGAFINQPASIKIWNSKGQLMQSLIIDEVQVPTQRLDTKNYTSGLYFIEIAVEGFPPITKKLSLLGR